MRTLIAEDNYESRLLMQRLLSPFGECNVAVNGKEAVEAFAEALHGPGRFDLICLDIMMPEMDGIEALKLIRQNEIDNGIMPQNEVKVIMVTALDTPKEVIDAYYNGGCTDYLVKPIEKAKLIKLIYELGLLSQ